MVLILSQNTTNPFVLIFYRYGIYSATMIVFFLAQCMYLDLNAISEFRAIGQIGLLAGLVFAGSNFFISYAFQTANIASVLVILAANSGFGACFAYVLLGEIPKLRTMLTGLVCFGAVVLITIEGLLNADGEENIFGIPAAVLASCSFGCYFVLLRMMALENEKTQIESHSQRTKVNDVEISLEEDTRKEGEEKGGGGEGEERQEREGEEEIAIIDNTNEIEIKTDIEIQKINPMPCNIIAGVIASSVSGFIGWGHLNHLSGLDLSLYFVNASIVLALSFTLLALAPALISAPEVSLFSLIETVVGPLWVWLGGYETPTVFSVIGGSFILFALFINNVMAIREGGDRNMD